MQALRCSHREVLAPSCLFTSATVGLNDVAKDPPGAMTTQRSPLVAATMKMDTVLPGWHPDPAQVGQLRWWNGREWTVYVHNAAKAVPRDKSVGVAFVLTFFFGAFGLFYVSAPIAIAALVINFVVLVLTLGLGLIFTWPAIIILGCIMAGRRHRDYQAWLLRHLATPDGPSRSTGPRWRTAMGSPRATAVERDLVVEEPPRITSMNGPAGWRPDPTGRFEVRWWTGDTWTAHVMNSGYRTIDPFWGR